MLRAMTMTLALAAVIAACGGEDSADLSPVIIEASDVTLLEPRYFHGIPVPFGLTQVDDDETNESCHFWAQSTVSADKAASTLLAHAQLENTACFTYDAWPDDVRDFYPEWLGEVRGMDQHSVATDDDSWSLRFSDGESEVLVVRTRLLDRRPILYLAHLD